MDIFPYSGNGCAAALTCVNKGQMLSLLRYPSDVATWQHAGVTPTRETCGVGVEKQAYRRIVARVALFEGGTERLAILLGVSSGLISQWIQGVAPIPPDMFFRCVDYLLDHQLPRDPATPAAAKDSDASPA